LLRKHPFDIHAWVVLLDHLHCVIGLPLGETDFATRWRLIGEHLIRDEAKFAAVHINPVKHGLVTA
jgi:putative transposase